MNSYGTVVVLVGQDNTIQKHEGILVAKSGIQTHSLQYWKSETPYVTYGTPPLQ
jgi:hypothetical protein